MCFKILIVAFDRELLVIIWAKILMHIVFFPKVDERRLYGHKSVTRIFEWIIKCIIHFSTVFRSFSLAVY